MLRQKGGVYGLLQKRQKSSKTQDSGSLIECCLFVSSIFFVVIFVCRGMFLENLVEGCKICSVPTGREKMDTDWIDWKKICLSTYSEGKMTKWNEKVKEC